MPVGINEIGENGILIYPNPASNRLFVEAYKLLVEEVNIYNAIGSLVSSHTLQSDKSIDISHLASGIYIAEIKTKEAAVKKRWVKM
jgi:hypothetical protein